MISYEKFRKLSREKQRAIFEGSLDKYLVKVKQNQKRYERLTWEYNTYKGVLSMMSTYNQVTKKRQIDKTTFKLKLKKLIELNIEQIEEELKELEKNGYSLNNKFE